MVSEPPSMAAVPSTENPSTENPNSGSVISSPTPNESIVILNIPVATKLKDNNFLVWQSQIVPILHGHGLHKYIEPNKSPPPTTDNNGSTILNPAYLSWHKQDQLLLGWIRSSLSESLLAQVVSCTTSANLWDTLHRTFSASSKARLQELRHKLQCITKGGSTCAKYLQQFRAIADELAFIGSPISDEFLVSRVLDGLGSNFNPFVTAIITRSDPISLTDLSALLLTNESLLNSQNQVSSFSVATNPSSFYSNPRPKQQYPKYQNQYISGPRPSGPRGSFFKSPQNSFKPVQEGILPTPSFRPTQPNGAHASRPPNPYKNETCQVCSKRGHVALGCWYRFDKRYGEPMMPPSHTPMARQARRNMD